MSERLTIRQLSEASGVSAHTLRYYERIGLMPRVTRNGAGHRRYEPQHVQWLRLLTRLKEAGMPIARMREYAALVKAGDETFGQRRRFLQGHRREVAQRLRELQAHLAVVDEKIELYRQKEQEHEPH